MSARRKMNREAAARALQERSLQWLSEVINGTPERAPGECRYCGRQIGRGLHKHERKCANDHARNDEG